MPPGAFLQQLLRSRRRRQWLRRFTPPDTGYHRVLALKLTAAQKLRGAGCHVDAHELDDAGANLAKPTNFGTRRTPSLGPICRCQALVPVPADLLRVLPAE
jgi:hypothetical protein